jgi:hypothetical protein
MKKMITALLAGCITFTGLGFASIGTQTAYADEITSNYSTRETITVIDAEEAAEINEYFEYEYVSAGDYKLDVYVTGKAKDTLFFQWTNYDTDALAPILVVGEQNKVLFRAFGKGGLATGFVNRNDNLFTFGFGSSPSTLKYNNTFFGTIYIKALKPYEGDSSIFPEISVAEITVRDSYNYAGFDHAAPEVILPAKETAETAKFDVDGDGAVRISDAVLMLRAICEGFEADANDGTPAETANGTKDSAGTEFPKVQISDLNGDGFVDISDILCMLEELAAQM